MRKYTRKKTSWGERIVYDSIEEAATSGIKEIKVHNDRSIKVGDWIAYPNGVVAEILHIYLTPTQKSGWSINKTILNVYRANKGDIPEGVWKDAYRLSNSDTRMDVVDAPKIRFAEDWLIHGKSLASCVTDNLPYQCKKYYKLPDAKISEYQRKEYAYHLINGEWFDKLLERNRVLRDRYMNLVGALHDNGINEDWVAKRIKEASESVAAVERINALNKVIDILKSTKNPNGGAVSAAFTDITEEERHKELTDGTSRVEPQAIPDEILNQALGENIGISESRNGPTESALTPVAIGEKGS